MSKKEIKTRTIIVNPTAHIGGVSAKKKGNLLQIIVVSSFLVIVVGLLYYFLIYNSDPKIRIEYSVSGSIEQKNITTFEQLYKSPSSIIVDVVLDKAPKKKYYLEINGTKNQLDFSADEVMFKAAVNITPDVMQNSYYTIKLFTDNSKTLYTDNFNVIILRPNISSKEYIENYLKLYSDAVLNKNSYALKNVSGFWRDDLSNGIYEKMSRNLPELFSLWYDNVMSTSNDDVKARVYLNYMNANKWTYVTAGYYYKLEVVKGSGGLPEWKISDADETIEKREFYNPEYFEGD